MNVDLDAQGKAVGAEPLAPFGDAAGVGTGRNWAHVNSVAYDESDDSIIISARHQGVMKIGRDKEVKWILAPSEGWKNGLEKKLLKPVDKDAGPSSARRRATARAASTSLTRSTPHGLAPRRTAPSSSSTTARSVTTNSPRCPR